MPFALLGAIFYDRRFPFLDGSHGGKLFTVLALSPAADYIVAKTTSKPDRKSWTYGCHNGDPYPNFFIPVTLKLFPLDTWICMDALYEFDQHEFQQRITTGALIEKGRLTKKVIKDLLDCAARADGTTRAQEKALRDELALL